MHDILRGLDAGRFTSKDVTAAYLRQIARYEDALNAFTWLDPTALEQACRSDWRRARRERPRPLEGVPIVLKESINVRGAPSTMGWNRIAAAAGGVALFPRGDAPVVARLRAAGAIILGKTNIPSFSDDGHRATSSWAGPTYNAVNRRYVPGASSSGTATAVAAGFCAWGMGEETGGSIQNPSAAQSLVGIKTTFGLVPTAGVTPLAASTRDVLGPIAKTVRDAALALNVITAYGSAEFVGRAPPGGYTAWLGRPALKGARVGLFGKGWLDAEFDAGTAELYRRAVDEIKSLGAIVVDDPFAGSGFAKLLLAGEPYDYRGTEPVVYNFNTYIKTLGVSSIDTFRDLVGVSPFDKGQPLEWYTQVLPVAKTSLKNPAKTPDLSRFAALRAKYLGTFRRVFAEKRLDALVYPHSLTAIPELEGEPLGFFTETTVSSIDIAGLPGVTVPSSRFEDENGPKPFSLIFVGDMYSEAKLLAMAHHYEQATCHRWLPKLA